MKIKRKTGLAAGPFGVLVLIIVLEIMAIIVFTEAGSEGGLKDAASVIAFVTAAALSIERTLETGWTMIGQWKGTFWPFEKITTQIEDEVNRLDNSMAEFVEAASQNLQEIQKVDNRISEIANSANQQVQTLYDNFGEIRKMAPSKQKIELLSTFVDRVKYIGHEVNDILNTNPNQLPPNQILLNQSLDKIKTTYSIAKLSIDGLTKFAGSFKDNPGRRLLSILAAVVLGLALSYFFKLDIFAAVLRSSESTVAQIVLTGIAIGLGAGPTHELIRALQEYKESKKI